MVSLLCLKDSFDLGDEKLVERWAKNVQWQFFSGMDCYEPRLPCDATQIGRFRRLAAWRCAPQRRNLLPKGRPHGLTGPRRRSLASPAVPLCAAERRNLLHRRGSRCRRRPAAAWQRRVRRLPRMRHPGPRLLALELRRPHPHDSSRLAANGAASAPQAARGGWRRRQLTG